MADAAFVTISSRQHARLQRHATHWRLLGERRREGVGERGHLPTDNTPPAAPWPRLMAAQRDKLQQTWPELTTKQMHAGTVGASSPDREAPTCREAQHCRCCSEPGNRTAQASWLASLRQAHATPRLRNSRKRHPRRGNRSWGDLSPARRRLGDAVMAADDERVLRRAEQQADQRTIAAQERTQILPTSLDAEQVVHELTNAGFAAQTGWVYLRSVLPADQLVTSLDSPSIVAAGMRRGRSNRHRARCGRLLDVHGVTTTTLVGLYPARAADEVFAAESPAKRMRDPRLDGLHSGLVDPERQKRQCGC